MDGVTGFSNFNFFSEQISVSSIFSQFNTNSPPENAISQNNSNNNMINISSQGRFRNFLGNMSKMEVSVSQINIKYTSIVETSAVGGLTEPGLDKMEAFLDALIKSFAKDDDEYKRLSNQLKSQIKIARAVLSKAQNNSNQPSLPHGAVSGNITRSQVEININIARVDGQLTVQEVQMQQSDPLILDLGGDGIELKEAAKSAVFDVNGDGKLDITGWVKGDDAFLALDRNQNGRIDDGTELFGDQNGAKTGFEELAKFDSNYDGVINSCDPIYKILKVYQDINSNGKIESNELTSLEKNNIESINLNFFSANQNINGNNIFLKGSYTTTAGEQRSIVDALLGYKVY